ncbi:MAG TPA: hypothetical protein VFC07_06720, partial [Verrucomicrobiae bacterium]|nr:hypothetical protein [Verrucomicrobiae bacterium]
PPAPSPATTAPATTPAPNNNPPVLTLPKPASDTAEVLKLTKAGVGEEVILAYVKSSRSIYNLSANDILYLKEEGVSSPVIAAMLNHDHSLRNPGPNQPPTQFNYDQQTYPPENQVVPGQSIAPPSSQPDASAGNAQIATPPLTPQEGTQSPPLQSEVIPVAPGPDYYWSPGYWGWNGGWTWIGGNWWPRGYYGWGWGGYHGGWGGYHGSWGGYHGSWGGSHGSWDRGSHGGTWSGGSHGGGGGSWGRSSGGNHGH